MIKNIKKKQLNIGKKPKKEKDHMMKIIMKNY